MRWSSIMSDRFTFHGLQLSQQISLSSAISQVCSYIKYILYTVISVLWKTHTAGKDRQTLKGEKDGESMCMKHVLCRSSYPWDLVKALPSPRKAVCHFSRFRGIWVTSLGSWLRIKPVPSASIIHTLHTLHCQQEVPESLGTLFPVQDARGILPQILLQKVIEVRKTLSFLKLQNEKKKTQLKLSWTIKRTSWDFLGPVAGDSNLPMQPGPGSIT